VPSGKQVSYDAFPLFFELDAHFFVVAGAAGDLRLLFLYITVDGVDLGIFIEE